MSLLGNGSTHYYSGYLLRYSWFPQDASFHNIFGFQICWWSSKTLFCLHDVVDFHILVIIFRQICFRIHVLFPFSSYFPRLVWVPAVCPYASVFLMPVVHMSIIVWVNSSCCAPLGGSWWILNFGLLHVGSLIIPRVLMLIFGSSVAGGVIPG